MTEKYPQGRLKIYHNTKSYLEWTYTWSKSQNATNEDARLILNMAIVWHYTDQTDSEPMEWTEEQIKSTIDQWLIIPANFQMNPEVKKYSDKLFATILENIWRNNLSIVHIRTYERVFSKAAMDIETAKIAGYLKLANIKTTIRPEILSFNGSSRKVPASHFACSIIIVIRSKATEEDISNFYVAKNQLDNKVTLLFELELENGKNWLKTG